MAEIEGCGSRPAEWPRPPKRSERPPGSLGIRIRDRHRIPANRLRRRDLRRVGLLQSPPQASRSAWRDARPGAAARSSSRCARRDRRVPRYDTLNPTTDCLKRVDTFRRALRACSRASGNPRRCPSVRRHAVLRFGRAPSSGAPPRSGPSRGLRCPLRGSVRCVRRPPRTWLLATRERWPRTPAYLPCHRPSARPGTRTCSRNRLLSPTLPLAGSR